MISLAVTIVAILYYIVWVGQGLLKPNRDLSLINIQYQLDTTTDEQWLQKLKDTIDFKLKQFEKELSNGEISQEEYKEKSKSYFEDYETIREDPKQAEEDIEYIKSSLKKNVIKTKFSILVVQLIYRLLAGVPLVVLLLTGSIQVSLILCFIFLLTYSIISDVVITRDENKITSHSDTDEEEFSDLEYNLSKVTLIAYTAVVSQIPYLVVLLLT